MGKPRDNVRYLDLKTNTEDKRKRFSFVFTLIIGIVIGSFLWWVLYQIFMK